MHPSMPTPEDQEAALKKWLAPGNRGMLLSSPDMEPRPKLKALRRKWAAGNEERLVASLKRFKSLTLRVKFELWEEDGNYRRFYKTLSGKTVVFRKIPTIGMLWRIVQAMTNCAVEIVKGTKGEEVNDKP